MPEPVTQEPGLKVLSTAVVIATRNRPGPLGDCLKSLDSQSLRPDNVIIIDSTDSDATATMIDEIRPTLSFPLVFEHTTSRSAARQRNIGAEKAATDLIVFLDDDVVPDNSFLLEIVKPFQSDGNYEIGGVSGAITNQVYSNPHGLNRFLLGLCLGRWRGSYAGGLLGPAVNFLPADVPNTVQEVDWLPSTCTAYRTQVFRSYRFCDAFEGYSFAEDVHLSSRVHKTHRLLNTTRARVFHHDLGKSTHRDWKALGESMVINRHAIMVHVLGRNRLLDHIRFLGYEIIYCSAAWLAAGISAARLAILVKLLPGKLLGFVKIWSGRGSAAPPLEDGHRKPA
jgi:glycosyltransferase involved in cell wall biosynthesis